MPRKININVIKQVLSSERIPIGIKKLISELNNCREKVAEKYKNMGLGNPNKIACLYKDMSEEQKKEYEQDILCYNFPIVIILCKKYSKYMAEDVLPDAYSHGFFSIVHYLQKYDCRKGAQFHTYMAASIRGEIIKFIDSSHTVKINYHYQKQKIKRELENTSENLLDEKQIEKYFSAYIENYRTILFSNIKKEDEKDEGAENIESFLDSSGVHQQEAVQESIAKQTVLEFYEIAKRYFEENVHNIIEKHVINCLFFDKGITYNESIKKIREKYPNMTYYAIRSIESNFKKMLLYYIMQKKPELYEKIMIYIDSNHL